MKKIIIVGASSGLGARIATDFARGGWRVGIAARREERLNELKEQFPANIVTKRIDVTQPDAVQRFTELIELCDGMDVLLFAAGIGFNDPELDPAQVHCTLETNVMGFSAIVTAAYRYFRDTANLHQGQIAAITSVAGVKALGVATAYSASKCFQQRFINCLEQLAYRRQVNVAFTDIRPGFISTPLLQEGKPYPMIMSVDYAAPLIEKAILRRRRVAYIDYRWGVAARLMQLVPQRIWRHLSLEI